MKHKKNTWLLSSIIGVSMALLGCSATPEKQNATVAQAEAFIDIAEKQNTEIRNIMDDTWLVSAFFSSVDSINLRDRMIALRNQTVSNNVYASAQFKDVKLNDEMTFRLSKLRSGMFSPQPENHQQAASLTELTTSLREKHANKVC